MLHLHKLAVLLLFLTFIVACQKDEPVAEIAFRQPEHFPQPFYDLSANPITTDGFELGKKLFYDPILSLDGSISCGSCHQQQSGFTQHGHPLSHGIEDRFTMRNSMPIQNLAWQKAFFWDGGVNHLDLFSPEPIQNPNEMGETMSNVLSKLRQHSVYPGLFEAAYGDTTITTERFLKSLSQFMLMCISDNSKYDQYLRNETTLTADEMAGLTLFNQKCESLPQRGLIFRLELPQQRLGRGQHHRHGPRTDYA